MPKLSVAERARSERYVKRWHTTYRDPGNVWGSASCSSCFATWSYLPGLAGLLGYVTCVHCGAREALA